MTQPKKPLGPKEIGALEERIADRSKKLQDELAKLDPELITEIRISRGAQHPGTHFSDWHDNWRDGPRWSKTWGKAGDDARFDWDKISDQFGGGGLRGDR